MIRQLCLRVALTLGLVSVALVATACGDDDAAPPAADGAQADAAADASGSDVADAGTEALADAAATGQFFPCDVEAVLRAKCHTCHTMPPRNGAPMSLLTWAATQNFAGGSTTVKIWQRAREYVASGYMPYLNSPTGPLTSTEKATLLTWLEGGALPAPAACVTDAGGLATDAP
jgi:uncharacterized membrane protein